MKPLLKHCTMPEKGLKSYIYMILRWNKGKIKSPYSTIVSMIKYGDGARDGTRTRLAMAQNPYSSNGFVISFQFPFQFYEKSKKD